MYIDHLTRLSRCQVPWALSAEEQKNYDQIFRAWDQRGTGFISGTMAQEVFGQSGLDRDNLMKIWSVFQRAPGSTDRAGTSPTLRTGANST